MKFTSLILVSLLTINISKAQTPPCTAAAVDLQATLPFNGCEGDLVEFFVNSNQPSLPGSFSWSRIHGALPFGMQQTTNDPFNNVNPFMAEFNDVYRVEYTDDSGCVSWDTAVVEVHENPMVVINEEQHCNGVHLTAVDIHANGFPYTYQWLESNSTDQTIIYSGPGGAASNQTVTVTNTWGCQAMVFTDELFPEIAKVTFQGGRKYTPGNFFRLISVCNYPVQKYKWYRNGVLLPNADKYFVQIRDTGLYKVKVRTTDGCYKVAARRIILREPSPRLDDADLELTDAGLSLYPVPATDILNIAGVADEEIVVMDLTGRVIRSLKAVNDPEVINVSDLRPGIYLVKAGDETARFVIGR